MKTQIKNYVLFVYIVITLLGAYSAALFYAGTQYAAHAATAEHVIVVKQAAPKN